METELWPNLLRALAARGVPTMIANGRISDRSFGRYRAVRWLLAPVLARVSVFAMQSEEDARRIVALGAPVARVVVTGNLKNDLAPAAGATAWETLLDVRAGDDVWVAGSTHRGEEAIVVDAFRRLQPRFPRLRLVLAPRHPERVAEVAALLTERGLRPIRRTALPQANTRGAVILLDTVGELADLYRTATVTFVGGSLVPAGGHNMLEPALRHRPVLYGVHTENFRDSASLLESVGGARVVKDGAELERAVAELLEDPQARRAMAEAAYAAVVARRGALAETLALVERFLVATPPGSGATASSRGATA
jgi:3-deoxy-D-manno-octulosonic-acid transferase